MTNFNAEDVQAAIIEKMGRRTPVRVNQHGEQLVIEYALDNKTAMMQIKNGVMLATYVTGYDENQHIEHKASDFDFDQRWKNVNPRIASGALGIAFLLTFELIEPAEQMGIE